MTKLYHINHKPDIYCCAVFIVWFCILTSLREKADKPIDPVGGLAHPVLCVLGRAVWWIFKNPKAAAAD